MDKQTTLAFVLIGAILIIWLYFSSPEQKPPVKQKSDSSLVKSDTAKINKPQVEEKKQDNAQQPIDTTLLSKTFAASASSEKIITIENSLVKLELTSNGARIRRWFLKKFNTWYASKYDEQKDFYKRHVQLVNADEGDLNLVFISKDGKLLNTAQAAFSTDANSAYYNIKDNDSLKISYSVPVGPKGKIIKNFTFKGNDYSTRLDVELYNLNDVISNNRYDLVWANGLNNAEKNSVDEANYSNASVYAAEEQTIVNSKMNEHTQKDFNGKIDWLGIRNKYFALIVAPLNLGQDGGAVIEGTEKTLPDGVKKYFNASIKVPFNIGQNNSAYQKNSFLVYLGPVDYNVLKSYDKSFVKIVDFGSFFGLKFIIRPISEYILLPLFIFLHGFIPNYGWVIILFSLIIKIALHPLTRSSMKSMKKMQMLQPKITELKTKLKDDPQKLNKETMKLYSTYGINPAGGCLPMLLQMPILVALWGLFNVAIQLRQQPFALWINNLAMPDIILDLPFSIPLLGVSHISGLALLLGITMFIQQKMSVKDPSQQALVYIMPVMFTLMFMGFPAGLNLYYFMFNLFSILQQWYVNHSHNNVELVPVANPKKSGGFMSKLMDAAEKSAQQQQKKKK